MYPWGPNFPGLKSAFLQAELEAQKEMGIVDPQSTPALEKKAEVMAEAVKSWMLQQELTITEMKASLEVETIKTSDTIDADIKPTRDLSMMMLNLLMVKSIIMIVVEPIKKMGEFEIPAGVPVLGGTKPFAFLLATITLVNTWFKMTAKTMETKIPKGNGEAQITNPKVNYSKDGADGGTLTATGHAYIGIDANKIPASDLTNNGDGITKVQLLETNITDESMQ